MPRNSLFSIWTEDNRPQVKADVDYEKGMGVSMGRICEDKVYDYKFVGLSHNTVRGAAGGAVLCAETLTALKCYSQSRSCKSRSKRCSQKAKHSVSSGLSPFGV